MNKSHFYFFSNKPPPSTGAQLPLPAALSAREQERANRKRKFEDSTERGQFYLLVTWDLQTHY